MDQKYFGVPFAVQGDTTVIPDAADSGGAVSFTQGWGTDYAVDDSANPNYKPLDRATTNWLFNAITTAVRAIQQVGVPEWISPTNNDGVAFPYALGAVVRYSATVPGVTFVKYVSTAANNTTVPGATGATWQPVVDYVASAAQATAGTDDTTVMTPLKVAQQIATVGSGRLINIQIITASSTYVVTPGTKRIDFKMVGGGASGGGAPGVGANAYSVAAGGSSGGYIEGTIFANIAASYPIVVGQGAVGNIGNGTPGTSTTAFGYTAGVAGNTFLSTTLPSTSVGFAEAGAPGAVSASNPLGIAYLAYPGNGGKPAICQNWTNCISGEGAHSPLGTGGLWRSSSLGLGNSSGGGNASGYGSGGGGAISLGSTGGGAPGVPGGNGAPGVVIIREYS